MRRTLAVLLLTTLAAGPAVAQSQGDWTLGLGIGSVMPKSGNGTLAGAEADISNGEALTITAEYFFADNWGIELLAATPFSHDISLDGLGEIGSTKHLPPTLSINYHFATESAWKPYIGAGINYTTFFEEETSLGSLELNDSWGIAVQAGLDYELQNGSFLRANVRWIDISTDAKLDGSDIGTAEIDPVVVSLAYVFKF